MSRPSTVVRMKSVQSLSRASRCNSLSFRDERTKINCLEIDRYAGRPLPHVGPPLKPRVLVNARSPVLSILLRSAVTKVVYRIVGFSAVDVVDLPFWPRAVEYGPCDAMSGKHSSAECAAKVTARSEVVERRLPSVSGVPNFSSPMRTVFVVGRKERGVPFFPHQAPSFRGVFKCLAKIIGRWQFSFSHVVSPYVRGQGRALLTQCFRPVFHSRIAFFQQAKEAMR